MATDLQKKYDELRFRDNLPAGEPPVSVFSRYLINPDDSVINSSDASSIETGQLSQFLGGTPNYDETRTMNAYAKLSAGTAPIRILGMGNSILVEGFIDAMTYLENTIGKAGATDSPDFIQIAGSATRVNRTDFFDVTGYYGDAYGSFQLLTSGQDSIWGGGIAPDHAVGDTFQIIYVAYSGGGSFKIQARKDSGTWIDQGAVVSTNNATTLMTATTRTLTDSGPWQIRILNTSGTVYMYCKPSIYRASGPGVLWNVQSIPGTPVSLYSNSPAPMRQGWLTALAPDVIFIRWYGYETGVFSEQITALKADLAAIGRSTTTDIVILGVSRLGPSGDAALQLSQVTEQRRAAFNNDVALIDLFNGFNARFTVDDVHPTTQGYAWSGWQTLHQLGWLEIPEVRQQAKHITCRNAYRQMADSTAFEVDAQIALYLTRGRWKIRGKVLVTGDTIGKIANCTLSLDGAGSSNIQGLLLRMVGYQGSNVWVTAAEYTYPFTGGGAVALPLYVMDFRANTCQDALADFEFELVVAGYGTMRLNTAKLATGGVAFVREGTYLEATKIGD